MNNKEAKTILSDFNEYLNGRRDVAPHSWETCEAIDVAIQCLSLPTDSERAEEVLMKCHTHTDDELGITWRSAIYAMTTYAAPYIAEVERLRKEIEEANKTIGRLQDRRKDLMDHCDSIKSELTAANQRIAELEKKIDKDYKGYKFKP